MNSDYETRVFFFLFFFLWERLNLEHLLNCSGALSVVIGIINLFFFGVGISRYI